MSNDETPHARAEPQSNLARGRRRFDLEERTASFGEAVIDFLKTVPLTPLTRHMVDQLVRASTSVGANYSEANDAGSRKEFRYRLTLCKRESRESKFWLRMIARARPDRRDASRTLYREADELNRIFAAIHRKSGPAPPERPR